MNYGSGCYEKVAAAAALNFFIPKKRELFIGYEKDEYFPS